MSGVRTVRLELLRQGRSDSHMLSSETTYLALCQSFEANTLTVPLEQRDLRRYARALRYEADEAQRAEAIFGLGERLGGLLAGITGFGEEVTSARDGRELVHVRLVLTAKELAQVPFELAHAPPGMPGSGAPLALQVSPAVVMTREVRRVPPPGICWPAEPRILVVAARSAGISEPLLRAHVLALRRAIDPWVPPYREPARRQAAAARLLTVLPDATLADVERTVDEGRYTHVHVLAHGARGRVGDEKHWGIRLRRAHGTDIVRGDRFASALLAASDAAPTVVTLAACNTGDVGSLLSPGASFAHALHELGIPFVVASQMPLSERGSVVLVRELYERLLWGDDPREALRATRRSLNALDADRHDWASIVCYATLPRDLLEQLQRVATVRARRALEAATEPLAEEGEVGARLDLARAVLERRQAARGRLEEAVQRYVQASPREQAELLGMLGGARRWDAWLLERLSGDVAHAERPLPDTLASLLPGADPEALRGASTAALRDAKELYFRAFRADPGTHWVAAQHLVLSVALGERDLDRRIVSTAALTAELALRDADEAARAWALATILELRLLESVLQEDLGVRGPDAMACARELTGLVGSRSPQAAHAAAQLRRLHTWWATASTNDALVDLIDRTLRILDPDGPR